MNNPILGLHHITAIAGNAKRNHGFYTKVLGLRLVKKTVNFDDPGTYHFYFGDEVGTPGSILIFFPWEGIGPGTTGTGMATEISYAVPAGSLNFWKDRFEEHKVNHAAIAERMGEQYLAFTDADGLNLNLVVPKNADNRKPWLGGEIGVENALQGFHSVTLTLKNKTATAAILTGIFGYELQQEDDNRFRYVTPSIANASVVDIVEEPNGKPGRNAAGTNHHVAFRVENDTILMQYREVIAAKGYNITPKIDRDYFFSLYFREPGGVLFELATDNPGFTKDEPLAELGTHLKLPKQYEAERANIEKVLPEVEERVMSFE